MYSLSSSKYWCSKAKTSNPLFHLRHLSAIFTLLGNICYDYIPECIYFSCLFSDCLPVTAPPDIYMYFKVHYLQWKVFIKTLRWKYKAAWPATLKQFKNWVLSIYFSPNGHTKYFNLLKFQFHTISIWNGRTAWYWQFLWTLFFPE